MSSKQPNSIHFSLSSILIIITLSLILVNSGLTDSSIAYGQYDDYEEEDYEDYEEEDYEDYEEEDYEDYEEEDYEDYEEEDYEDYEEEDYEEEEEICDDGIDNDGDDYVDYDDSDCHMEEEEICDDGIDNDGDDYVDYDDSDCHMEEEEICDDGIDNDGDDYVDYDDSDCRVENCHSGVDYNFSRTSTCPPADKSPPKCPEGQNYDENSGECIPKKIVKVKDTPPTSFNLIASINQTEKINTDVGGQKIPFQYLVIINDEISHTPRSFQSTLQVLANDVELMGAEILYRYEYAIQGFAFKAPNQETLDEVLSFLQNEPNVSVEQDQITVPFADELPTGILRIDAAPLHNVQGYSSRDVDSDIAIIDSGVDLDHPDLNVYRNTTVIIPGGESSKNQEFADKYIDRQKIALNTYDNELAPYPPFSLDTSPSGDDKCGHGTQVAGVAAAKDNSVGILGVAPGARVWAVKVLEFDKSTGKCEGSMSSAIAGINFVTRNAHEIDVANLSFGCLCKSDALHEAISRSIAAGVMYVVAAGNINVDAATFSPAESS